MSFVKRLLTFSDSPPARIFSFPNSSREENGWKEMTVSIKLKCKLSFLKLQCQFLYLNNERFQVNCNYKIQNIQNQN